MKKYEIGGMSCAACSARVEKAVGNVDGISSCAVNLLTNTMVVEGNANESEIIAAVEKAGYTVKNAKNKTIEKKTTSNTKIRLVFSIVLSMVLMYFSMGYTMWDFPLPEIFDNNVLAIALIQMVLSGIVLVINQKFFINGYKGVLNKSPNMDTLVAMGSGISFIYSTMVVFFMTFQISNGNYADAAHGLHDLYFESAAMILTLITLGKLLEEYSKGKTTNAIEALINLAPKTAVLLSDGKEVLIPVEELKSGDVFVVKPGASIPADGVVIEGVSSVDESMLTGESIPADKEKDSKVSAATMNISGHLVCKATKVGEDTTLAHMIRMVNDAASSKAPIAKIANKVSAIFVPFVILIAVLTTIIWIIAGQSVGFSLARGISVLVISCPCALGLATPVAIMVGNGVGAKNGILFKTAESLEETGRAEIIVFDKTGTLTKGSPEVTDVISDDINEILSVAYALEAKSEHPLAKAIVEYCSSKNIQKFEIENFRIFPGNGLEAESGIEKIFGGNKSFLEKQEISRNSFEKEAERLALEGKTPMFFGKGKDVLGIIAVADSLKSESVDAVVQLKKMGMEVVMLTGDNKRTADFVAKKCGIDNVIAEVLPDGKENEIKKLKKRGKVIMAGDGINDAPALTTADIGIAVGAGTDIAIDAADVVLQRSRLSDIVFSIELSRAVLRNIKQNLFWAFCYNIIGIPLAAGAFIYNFNLELNPMFGAAAMSLSSFLVVTNSLRLNFIKTKKHKKKENKIMEVTVKIEGMMCPHCEGRVKQKLEELDGVSEVYASHLESKAVLKFEKDVPLDLIEKTIEEQGYKVVR